MLPFNNNNYTFNHHILKSKSKSCSFCDIKTKNMFNYTHIKNNDSFTLCYFCNIIFNSNDYSYKNKQLYDKYISYTNHNKFILVHSLLSQSDINNKTYKFILNNQKAPLLSDIDPDFKLIDISSPNLIKVFQNCSSNELAFFKNIKFMFSDHINIEQVPHNIFNYKPTFFNDFQFFTNILHNSNDIYNLNDKQTKIYSKYI
jgi:hypothetical protein